MNRKHKSDRAIGVITIVLLMIGLVMIYAIGPMTANYLNAAYGFEKYSTNYFFVHQLISTVLALIVFFMAFKFPYEKVSRIAKWVMVAGVIACVLLALLSLGKSSLASCQLGACRWFRLGPMSFQPAELIKIGLVLYLSQLAARRKQEGALDKSDFWLPFLVVSAIVLLLVVVVQKDLGTGVSLIAIMLAILWMSGVNWKNILIIVVLLIAFGVLAVATSEHRWKRILAHFGGGNADSSYQVENALIAIGRGGVMGAGIGNSIQATGYLPESINDSIFAVIGETFGFVGLMVVVGGFAVLLMRLLKVAEKIEELEYRLIVAGVFAWLTSQVTMNIMAMTRLIPVTGITLPLLSYGGTSLVFTAAALGLCLQISCYTGREVKKHESVNSGRGVGRTYHAGRRRRS